MSEKKVVSRNIAVALAIIATIFLFGLAGTIASYTLIMGAQDSIMQNKNTQILTLTNQNDQLQTSLESNQTLLNQLQELLEGNKTLFDQTQTWLEENITYYEAQISLLNSQIQGLSDGNDQLLMWLYGNITYYTSQINLLNSQITDLQNQISSLNSQIATLQSQIIDLQNQIAALTAPKLINVNLRAEDMWAPKAPNLHIYGEICNVGTNTAYNCGLQIVAYQEDDFVAINTTISIGTINGEYWTSVDESIPYSGDPLVSWLITPEWTDSP